MHSSSAEKSLFFLHNVTITVSDLDAAVTWWVDVFGMDETARSRFEAINADVAYS
jgi:catechol 2,3-dioxygenase-like lactoylglutathione lyase family enzyme